MRADIEKDISSTPIRHVEFARPLAAGGRALPEAGR